MDTKRSRGVDAEILDRQIPRVSDRRTLRDLTRDVNPRVAGMCAQVAVRQLDEDDAWQVARAYTETDEEARRYWARVIASPAARNLLQRMRCNESMRHAMTPGAIVSEALDLLESSKDDRVKLGCLKVIADMMPKNTLAPPPEEDRAGADAAATGLAIMASYVGAAVDLPPPRALEQGDLGV